MPPVTQPSIARITVGEYLEIERASLERHNYLDGIVFPVDGPVAMAGESNAHGDISTNIVISLGGQLKGKPCRVKSKDTRVRSGKLGPWNPRATAGMYSYPDVIVVCGEPTFHDERTDILTNPAVILEVLSPSTELFDRVEKFARFREWNPSLTNYLLVSQDTPRVEQYTRQSDGRWWYECSTGLDASVTTPSIGCTLRLADIYDRVTFPAPDPDPVPEE
ncbi:MAG: Uma2 family endonuclease [Fimbriiglobus sp.]